MGEKIMKNQDVVIRFRFPLDVYEKLKKLARKEHRKINQQVAYLCEEAMLEKERKDKLEKIANE